MENKDSVLVIVRKYQKPCSLYFLSYAIELPFDILIVIDFAGITFLRFPTCYQRNSTIFYVYRSPFRKIYY